MLKFFFRHFRFRFPLRQGCQSKKVSAADPCLLFNLAFLPRSIATAERSNNNDWQIQFLSRQTGETEMIIICGHLADLGLGERCLNYR